MKAQITSVTGTKKGEVTLPFQFHENVRPDIIKRAFLAQETHKLQAYGTSPDAGFRHATRISKRRKDYKGTWGKGQNRSPRKTMWSRGAQFGWEGALTPNAKGGRMAHPPKVEKVVYEKVNKKERRMAIRSAITSTTVKELVLKKHLINDLKLPIIIESKAESLKKSKEVVEMLLKLGLENELERISEKKIRAGRGKMRGRKYKRKVGPLIVTSKPCELTKSARNVQGVQVVPVRKLSVSALAPGSHAGRLTIFTEGAVELMEKEALFK